MSQLLMITWPAKKTIACIDSRSASGKNGCGSEPRAPVSARRQDKLPQSPQHSPQSLRDAEPSMISRNDPPSRTIPSRMRLVPEPVSRRRPGCNLAECPAERKSDSNRDQVHQERTWQLEVIRESPLKQHQATMRRKCRTPMRLDGSPDRQRFLLPESSVALQLSRERFGTKV